MPYSPTGVPHWVLLQTEDSGHPPDLRNPAKRHNSTHLQADAHDMQLATPSPSLPARPYNSVTTPPPPSLNVFSFPPSTTLPPTAVICRPPPTPLPMQALPPPMPPCHNFSAPPAPCAAYLSIPAILKLLDKQSPIEAARMRAELRWGAAGESVTARHLGSTRVSPESKFCTGLPEELYKSVATDKDHAFPIDPTLQGVTIPMAYFSPTCSFLIDRNSK